MSPVPGAVRYDAVEIPSAGGVVYAAPDCPTDIAQAALRFSDPGRGRDGLSYVDHGDYGIVYRMPQEDISDLAVKVNYELNPWVNDLSALRANVSLEVGLRTVGPMMIDIAENGDPEDMLRFSAPTIHAAFVPFEETAGVRPVWIMDFVDGKPDERLDATVPEKIRESVYSQALAVSGLRLDEVRLDDEWPNTLLRSSKDYEVDVVKIDIQAKRYFDF